MGQKLLQQKIHKALCPTLSPAYMTSRSGCKYVLVCWRIVQCWAGIQIHFLSSDYLEKSRLASPFKRTSLLLLFDYVYFPSCSFSNSYWNFNAGKYVLIFFLSFSHSYCYLLSFDVVVAPRFHLWTKCKYFILIFIQDEGKPTFSLYNQLFND